MAIVKGPALPSLTGTAPHGSASLIAIRSAGMSIVSTGVAFWNLLGREK